MSKLNAVNVTPKATKEDRWDIFDNNFPVGHILKVHNTRDVVNHYKVFAGVGACAICVGSTLGPLRLAVAHLEKALA